MNALAFFLCENFNPAPKQGASIQRRPLFVNGCISVLIFYIINVSRANRHLSSGQGVCKNITMEMVVLGHHISKVHVFWMLTTGKKLPLAWEDAIKHKKYAVVMATHSTAKTTAHSMSKTTAHSMAFTSLKLTSNDLC